MISDTRPGLEMVDSIKRRVSAPVSVAEVSARRERFASGHRRWDSIPWW